jgi:trehalose-phosphatase
MKNLLMLDFDGTLAPFSQERHNVRIYPGVLELLRDIADRGRTELVFVTGRRAEELDRLLSFRGWREIWGEHGLERRTPDGATELKGQELSGGPVDRALAVLTASGLAEHIEQKKGGVAIHWSGLPQERKQQVRHLAITSLLRSLRPDTSCRFMNFQDGLEFRFSSRTKGDAVREILQAARPAAKIAYLGDDITDETAFEAMEGAGESVLVRTKYRPTLAKRWLRPPEELIAYLEKWREEDGGTYESA